MEDYNIKISDNTKFHLQDSKNGYIEYIKNLEKISPEEQRAFLSSLETQEIINNQTIENENSFLISLYSNLQNENVIEYLCQIYNEKLNLKNINRLHNMLIFGTRADQPQNARYRDGTEETDYQKWVGYYKGNEKVIHYIPPNPRMVISKMLEIINFINSDDAFSDIFIKQFIFHQNIAALQPFGDGNTRTARFLQYGDIWVNTNNIYQTKFNKPIIYLSHRYKLYAGTYRMHIRNVVLNNNDEAWNSWFEFNLNMVDETLYKNCNDLKTLMKRKNSTLY